jgi:hypothetical protein
MKSGNKKGGESTFSKPHQILEFNLLIINHLIFLLTVILDNSGYI